MLMVLSDVPDAWYCLGQQITAIGLHAGTGSEVIRALACPDLITEQYRRVVLVYLSPEQLCSDQVLQLMHSLQHSNVHIQMVVDEDWLAL